MHQRDTVDGIISDDGVITCQARHKLAYLTPDLDQELYCRNCNVTVRVPMDKLSDASLARYGLENVRRIIALQEACFGLIGTK